jgi:hypothetical protein
MAIILKNSKATSKSVLAIVIVVLLTICVTAGFIAYQLMPITPKEDNQINVKITDFSMVDKQWLYLGATAFDCGFTMTIENKGVSDLTGLELKVKLFNNGSEVPVGNYFACTYENGTVAETLHAGEARSCNGIIMCNVGDAAYETNISSNETAIVAQIILNNIVLDEKTATFP